MLSSCSGVRSKQRSAIASKATNLERTKQKPRCAAYTKQSSSCQHVGLLGIAETPVCTAIVFLLQLLVGCSTSQQHASAAQGYNFYRTRSRPAFFFFFFFLINRKLPPPWVLRMNSTGSQCDCITFILGFQTTKCSVMGLFLAPLGHLLLLAFCLTGARRAPELTAVKKKNKKINKEKKKRKKKEKSVFGRGSSHLHSPGPRRPLDPGLVFLIFSFQKFHPCKCV